MGFNSVKCKTTIKMAVSRTKLYQRKRGQEVEILKANIADLMKRDKNEMAKIKTEQMIRIEYEIEALELLQLYCELLIARFPLLESAKRNSTPAEEIGEAVYSIAWASKRIQIKEFSVLVNEQFVSKFGKKFSLDIDNADEWDNLPISHRIRNKLGMMIAEPHLVLSSLKNIAKKYQLTNWDPIIAVPELVDSTGPGSIDPQLEAELDASLAAVTSTNSTSSTVNPTDGASGESATNPSPQNDSPAPQTTNKNDADDESLDELTARFKNLLK